MSASDTPEVDPRGLLRGGSASGNEMVGYEGEVVRYEVAVRGEECEAILVVDESELGEG